MAKKKQQPIPRKSGMKSVYAAVAVLIVAIIALYLYSGSSDVTVIEKTPTAGKFIKMNKPTTYEEDKVKIVEFMKFDCPHCYDIHRELPGLLKKYEGKIEITYVPIAWPQQSTKSIEAYILANQMGKGEEMKNALFEAQDLFQKGGEKGKDIMESTIAIEDVAASIGLGADFNAKFEKGDGRKAALANLGLMSDYGVQGTPTIIINGNINVNPPTIENLDAVIGSLLNSS